MTGQQYRGAANEPSPSTYKPISDYGAIGDLHATALVGRDGSIDWCCFPELDDGSVFAALLDVEKGGCFALRCVSPYRTEQQYIEGTNVLETVFETGSGRLRVVDFMPLRGSIVGMQAPPTTPRIYRFLECLAGEVEVAFEWSPRFDYARAETTIVEHGRGFLARGGDEHMILGGVPEAAVTGIVDDGHGPALRGRFSLSAGERQPLVARYGSKAVHTSTEFCQAALEDTIRAWRDWSQSSEMDDRFAEKWHDALSRSGLVLKLLTHPSSGAIAAAPTTSLPEEIGGVRNWDYRYSWIRDASFTAQALVALGHEAEAVDFINWAERVSMAKQEEQEAAFSLQIMYGLHGETELPEVELDHLEGYRGSRPVRIGNAAAEQRQLDIYGELLSAAYELTRIGGRLDASLKSFLTFVADEAAAVWDQPDYGIWEVRGGPQHFVHSKVMAWVALDRAIAIDKKMGLPGDADRWARERDAIHRAVLTEGYDEEIGAFVQAFGSKALDAANLVIPMMEFLPPDDPRVQGTIDRTLDELTEEGLVYRYLTDDGLPGHEGAFGLTTFWMVDALALSGRLDEAREIFQKMVNRANHLGLYAEEIDPRTGQFLGNFPQGFTHIGLINSALYLARAQQQRRQEPAPLGSRQHSEELGHATATTI